MPDRFLASDANAFILRDWPYKARVKWSEEEVLDLNFKPLYEAVGKHMHLIGQTAMVHWQARPKGKRRWGIFVRSDGRDRTYYYVADSVQLEGKVRTVQLNEANTDSLPSAVLLMENCKIHEISDGVNTIFKIWN